MHYISPSDERCATLHISCFLILSRTAERKKAVLKNNDKRCWSSCQRSNTAEPHTTHSTFSGTNNVFGPPTHIRIVFCEISTESSCTRRVLQYSYMLESSGMWTSRLDTPALSSQVSDQEQFCRLRSLPSWYSEVSLADEAEARRVDSVTSVSSCGLISGHTSSCSLEIGGVRPALGYVAFDEAKTNAKIDEMLGKHSAARGERLSTRQAVFNKVRRLLPQSWPQRSRSASTEPRGVHTTAACPAAVNAPDGRENKTSRRLFEVEVQTPPRLRVGSVRPAVVPGTTVPSPISTRRPRSDRVEEFHRALDNELVRLAFGRFCKKTLSSENVEFVRKVRCKDVLL